MSLQHAMLVYWLCPFCITRLMGLLLNRGNIIVLRCYHGLTISMVHRKAQADINFTIVITKFEIIWHSKKHCFFFLIYVWLSVGHPWIQVDGVAPDKPLDSAVLSRLKQFSAMNKLKKMALIVSIWMWKLESHLLCDLDLIDTYNWVWRYLHYIVLQYEFLTARWKWDVIICTFSFNHFTFCRLSQRAYLKKK